MLASGSTANAALVQTNKATVLIDCGLAYRELAERLRACSVRPEYIDAVVLTHEHGDHSGALKAFLKQTLRNGRDIPVYVGNPKISEYLQTKYKIDSALWKTFDPGERFRIHDLAIDPFNILHDCIEPMAFRFDEDGTNDRIGFAIDLGEIPPAMIHKFNSCQTVVIESNHDYAMLLMSQHPVPVKTRILSDKGHLSNEQTSEFLRELANPRLTTVVLAHLSGMANTWETALESASTALAFGSTEKAERRIMVAPPHELMVVE